MDMLRHRCTVACIRIAHYSHTVRSGDLRIKSIKEKAMRASRQLLLAGVIVCSSAFCLNQPALAATNDIWSELADKNGDFSPHVNFCASTEAYVTVGGALGFCIEKSERTAAHWEDAK